MLVLADLVQQVVVKITGFSAVCKFSNGDRFAARHFAMFYTSIRWVAIEEKYSQGFKNIIVIQILDKMKLWNKFIIMVLYVTIVSCSSINKGLINYYPFNGNAYDKSGNRSHGKVHGATLDVDRFGNEKNSYTFNGVDNYILIPYKFDILPRTINIWIKVADKDYYGSYGSIFQSDNPNQLYGNIGIAIKDIDGAKKLLLTMSAVTDTIDIATNKWYNIVMLANSHKKLTFYVNGILVGKKNVTKFLSSIDGLGLTVIGSNRSASNQYFKGQIDDIRIYNRLLSKREIKKIYRSKN